MRAASQATHEFITSTLTPEGSVRALVPESGGKEYAAFRCGLKAAPLRLSLCIQRSENRFLPGCPIYAIGFQYQLPCGRTWVQTDSGWLPVALVLGGLLRSPMPTILFSRFRLCISTSFRLASVPLRCPKEVSYSLAAVCIFLHDYFSPRTIHPGPRIFDNLAALLCFFFVVYVIQRYIEQTFSLTFASTSGHYSGARGWNGA